MTDLRSLRQLNAARQAVWSGADQADTAFRAIELSGEVGELMNLVKKRLRADRRIMGNKGADQDRASLQAALADELADVVICADLLATCLGIDLAAAVPAKFNATSRKHRLDVMFAEGGDDA